MSKNIYLSIYLHTHTHTHTHRESYFKELPHVIVEAYESTGVDGGGGRLETQSKSLFEFKVVSY